MLYPLFQFFVFLLGLAWGSFLIAWVYRTRHHKSIVRGRSECPLCGYKLRWYDLVPVLSFFFLQGKCRVCKQDISYQYPVVELVTGILFVIVFHHHFFGVLPQDIWVLGYWIELVRDLVIVFFLQFVFLYDIFYGEIPWKSTFFPGIILFVCSFAFSWHTPGDLFLGIAVGAGFFLFQFLISKGKWIGGGDIGMGFFMGVVLGWPLILLALFIAYVGGSLVLLPFVALKRLNKKSKIPFGTFLSVATFLAMMWGDKILSFLSL